MIMFIFKPDLSTEFRSQAGLILGIARTEIADNKTRVRRKEQIQGNGFEFEVSWGI